MTSENGKLSTLDAQALIQADRTERESKALKELEQVLKDNDCRLEIITVIRMGQLNQSFIVVAN